MSLEEIKTEVAGMSLEQQDQLAAYLVHLRHQRAATIREEITARIDEKDPGKWVSLEELREQWKDRVAVEPYRVLVSIEVLQLERPSRRSLTSVVRHDYAELAAQYSSR